MFRGDDRRPRQGQRGQTEGAASRRPRGARAGAASGVDGRCGGRRASGYVPTHRARDIVLRMCQDPPMGPGNSRAGARPGRPVGGAVRPAERPVRDAPRTLGARLATVSGAVRRQPKTVASASQTAPAPSTRCARRGKSLPELHPEVDDAGEAVAPTEQRLRHERQEVAGVVDVQPRNRQARRVRSRRRAARRGRRTCRAAAPASRP